MGKILAGNGCLKAIPAAIDLPPSQAMKVKKSAVVIHELNSY